MRTSTLGHKGGSARPAAPPPHQHESARAHATILHGYELRETPEVNTMAGNIASAGTLRHGGSADTWESILGPASQDERSWSRTAWESGAIPDGAPPTIGYLVNPCSGLRILASPWRDPSRIFRQAGGQASLRHRRPRLVDRRRRVRRYDRRQCLLRRCERRRVERARRPCHHFSASTRFTTAEHRHRDFTATFKWRRLIDNFFCKLNEFKRVARRADQTGQSSVAMISLAAAITN